MKYTITDFYSFGLSVENLFFADNRHGNPYDAMEKFVFE